MPARTADEVQDTLDAAFGWRRIEMATLVAAMRQAQNQSPSSPLSRALARSCAAVIYAHWEGFVKEACQCYTDFVAKRRLRFEQLNDGFLKTALMHLARRVASGDEVANAVLLDVVRRPTHARAHIPRTSMVDTKSNLRFGVLCDILAGIGISSSTFETKANFIDKSLCDMRNTIAHGREMFPDTQQIETMHGEVLVMMEAVRNLVMAAVRMQMYVRPTT